MKDRFTQKIIYNFVSYVLVYPVFRFIFRGKVIGLENIPKNTTFIIVSNHGSLLDPPFLGHALGLRVSFMAKSELFHIPILSSIISACGAYPVRRGIINTSSIKTATEKLLTNNIIGIFIDGTRQINGRVNKPKKGAALISAKTKKLLLPVAIINSHRLVRFKFLIPFFNKVVIKIGKPINYPLTLSKSELNKTTELVKDCINTLFDF